MPNIEFRVVEIFNSIEGEGIRAGMPCTFIRFAGCNLRCSYCDTAYAQNYDMGESMSAEQIIAKVSEIGCKNITLTGGEPLAREDVDYLLKMLALIGFEVNVETNGTQVPPVRDSNIFYTVDYKCITSGANAYMRDKVFETLMHNDVLKAVVGSVEDMDDVVTNILPMIEGRGVHVYFSPVFGAIDPKEIVEYLKEHHLDKCRMQLQLHKIIWDAEERGV